jgi:hypothetical protein
MFFMIGGGYGTLGSYPSADKQLEALEAVASFKMWPECCIVGADNRPFDRKLDVEAYRTALNVADNINYTTIPNQPDTKLYASVGGVSGRDKRIISPVVLSLNSSHVQIYLGATIRVVEGGREEFFGGRVFINYVRSLDNHYQPYSKIFIADGNAIAPLVLPI